MENRRNFFKALGMFAAGVVGAKVSSYIPKKEEKKEELQVAESIVVKDKEGKEYNMVVVPKQEQKPIEMPKSSSFDSGERMRVNSNGFVIGSHVPETALLVTQNKKPRKLNA